MDLTLNCLHYYTGDSHSFLLLCISHGPLAISICSFH